MLGKQSVPTGADLWKPTFCTLDAKGIAIAVSNDSKIAGSSYADRPHFKIHVNNGMQCKLYVDEPDVGRFVKQKLFFLSRRVLQQNYLVAGAGLGALLVLMLGAGHFSLRTYLKQEDRELRYRDLYAASREMRESMKLAAMLFQNSGEAMMVTNTGGKILTVDPAYSLLSGYTEKELIGHRGYEVTAGREDMTMFDRMFESVEQSGQWQVLSELRNADDVVRTTQQTLRQMSAPFDLASGKICKAEALVR